MSIEGVRKGYHFREKWYIKGQKVGPLGPVLTFAEYSPGLVVVKEERNSNNLMVVVVIGGKQ